MTNTKKVLFSLVLVLAIIVRSYKLTDLPLFNDEIDIGYQAFSLSQTLHDYKGNFLPTYIQSFTESRAPLQIYATIPFVLLFGLNPLSVRLVPLTFGILSLVSTYLLIKKLTQDSKLALLSMAVLAFTPWHIHYSRAAFEVMLQLFLTEIGLLFFISYKTSKKFIHLSLAVIFAAATFYTYNTSNLLTPLLFLPLLFDKKIYSQKKHISFALVLGILITLPLIYQILFGAAKNRFQLVSIFNNPQSLHDIIQKRTGYVVGPSTLLNKVFYNRPTDWVKQFTTNYITSLSPSFLFLSGDTNPRHSLPNWGLVLPSLAIFWLIGLLLCLKNKSFPYKYLLYWLSITPLASALTAGGGTHATRLFLMLLPISFFIAYGIKSSPKLVLSVFLFIFVINFSSYYYEYLFYYPKENYTVWNYQYDQFFGSIPKNYNKIIISNRFYNSLLPFLFYQKYDPKKLLTEFRSDVEVPNLIYESSGFKLSDNIYFVNKWKDKAIEDIDKYSSPGDVFLLFQNLDIPGAWNLKRDPLPKFTTLSTIFLPDGNILGQVIQRKYSP